MIHHHEWVEIKDFSGGLWTSQDWQIPPNGAAQLTDCYPHPAGGLRAFGRFSTVTSSGIAVDEEPIALWIEDHIAGQDYFLITTDGTTAQKLYRMNESAGETTWTLKKTFALTANISAQAYMTSYQLAARAKPDIYMTTSGNGADAGLWKITYDTGIVSRPVIGTVLTSTLALTGPLRVHQDCLVVAEDFSEVWFTNPGVETIADTNFIEAAASYRLRDITFMRSFRPDDLLLATRGAPWFFIQGDLTDPIIRGMGDVRHSSVRQIIAEMDEGIAFQAVLDGIYTTPDGARFNKISEPISVGDLWGTTASELALQCGAMAYIDNWLFHPSGHIYDSRTKAWFKTSFWSQSISAFAMQANKHRTQHRLVVAKEPVSAGTALVIYTLQPFESGMNRMRTFTYQSPPFHDDQGWTMEIDEVHVVSKVFANGGSMAITVNGTTRSVTGLNSGRQVVPALFRERAHQLDVTIVPESGSDSVEAPSIESIRIAYQRGHLLRRA